MKIYFNIHLTNLLTFIEYSSACTQESPVDYFQIIDGELSRNCVFIWTWSCNKYIKNLSYLISAEDKALELIEDDLVFSVNEKQDNQFWYFANPGDEYGLIFGKNSQKVLDIFTTICADNFCKVGTWSAHNGDNQLWKIDGDDLISKWNNAKFVVNQIFGPSVYTGQDQIDGGDIFIDDTSTPIFNPTFEGMYNKNLRKFALPINFSSVSLTCEKYKVHLVFFSECSDGASEKFPQGNV